MLINIWLGISTQAQTLVLESIRWDTESQGPYTGPLTNRQQRLFRYMQDETTRRNLFKRVTLQGIEYNLWSIDFDDDRDTLQEVHDELDGLITQYPNQIAILGAWHIDTGEQIGTRNGGDPTYPIPNFLWQFMPELLDENGDPTPSQPSSNADLHDVNLLFGQAPRSFV